MGLSFDRKATSETQFLSLQFPVPSLGYLRPQRKGQLVLFLRHFPQLDLSTVVAPSGGVQRTQSTRERPPHISPPKGRVSPSNRLVAGHLERVATLCFLALAPHRHACIPEASEALWDANSTTVCWGCQGGIPIYCIPVLTSGMLAPTLAFPQTPIPGNHSRLLKTAKNDKRKKGERKNQKWHDCDPCHPNLPGFRSCGRSSSCRHLSTSRTPALQIRNRKVAPAKRGQLLNHGTHGYVDVLKNFPRRDPLRPVGGLNQIVASLTAMLSPERIPEF